MCSVQTRVDLAKIRSNAEAIARAVGPGVELIGVVKADAYGLGAVAVADAIADLVTGWYVFAPGEAVEARLFDLTGKPTIAACVDEDADVEMLRDNGIRPAVWTVAAARRFASLDPVLCVDTGMQRFACPAEELDALFAAHAFTEAFTHAARPEQARRFVDLTARFAAKRPLKRHAAASALIADPSCRLDAVRPGLALYDGAARVTATLIDARDSRGPVGYSGFASARHGVIRAGYSDGLRRGPAIVNGRPQRVVEVGMQTAYVSLDAKDRAGDDVVLLGDDLSADAVAKAWGCSPQEAIFRLASMGEKTYG